MDLKKIKKQALKEIAEEQFKAEVEKCKERLLKVDKARWYKRLIPFRIVLLSRDRAYLLNQLIEECND